MEGHRTKLPLVTVIVVGILAAVMVPLMLSSEQRLVVYCAHDQQLAEGVISRFEQSTGIQVDVRYDEEANKSLGLTQLLIAEKDSPRADVFWNNQLLGTMPLHDLVRGSLDELWATSIAMGRDCLLRDSPELTLEADGSEDSWFLVRASGRCDGSWGSDAVDADEPCA